MTQFVILSALLVAGALLFVLPPLLGRGARRRAHEAKRAQAEVAIAVLREQLAELKSEHAEGRIDDEAFARSRAEIEARVLEEGQVVEDGADQRPALMWAVAMVVAVPVLAIVVYAAVGEPDALDPTARFAHVDPASQEITEEQVFGLVAQLAERLERDPSDETGWAMLARSYMMLGDFDLARATWTRIGDRMPENSMLFAEWADVLVAAQEGDFEGEPRQLIERSLELDPENFKALALAGAAAFEREDYANASAYWERILDQVPREDPAYDSVVASINEARSRGGLALLDVPQTSAVPAPLSLRGSVRLSEGLAEGLTPEATVFIFVRAAEGGIPFAAIRFPAVDLPTSFDFTRAPRMNDAPIPAEVMLVARVSMSGDAAARAGDLEAAPVIVSPDASGAVLVIDRVRP